MLTHDETQALEFLERQAHRRAGERIALGKLTLGGHEVAGAVLVFDLLGEDVDKLIVERLLTRCHRHGPTSYSGFESREERPLPHKGQTALNIHMK